MFRVVMKFLFRNVNRAKTAAIATIRTILSPPMTDVILFFSFIALFLHAQCKQLVFSCL